MLTKYRHGLMWLCMLCISTSTVFAQQKTVDKKWYGLVQQGIVFNMYDVQVQPSIAGGFQYKGFGAGLAGSFDFISLNSFQLSADLRKSVAVGKQYLFAYANPGLNIVSASKKDKDELSWRWYGENYDLKNGYYLEAGGGILIGKKKNLLAAFYWSRKTHSVQYIYEEWNPSTSERETTIRKDKYEFNRLGIKLGFIF